MPLVLNTGPLPDEFGVGSLMPFSRMQVANFVSAVLEAALPERAAPPPGKFPPPHFLIAAWNCAAVTPFGS